MSPPATPATDDYGTGCYRRSVRLRNGARCVTGELEDSHHGMTVELAHDGSAIVAATASFPRVPTNLCDGAGRPLREFVGLPLDLDTPSVLARLHRRQHCTHLLDLALLAHAHARRNAVERRFDVTIPDAPSGTGDAEVVLNGRRLHRWKIDEGVIRAPEILAGQPVLTGLIARLADLFSGDEFEGALVLQKGFLVSQARRIDRRPLVGRPIVGNVHMHGVCHAYNSPRLAEGVVLDSMRDFTHRPHRLLAFDP